jgi:hypothetical protein
MKIFYAVVFTILGITQMTGQSYVHQVIFLNEGWYDFVNDTLAVPPSVGSYDPETKTYQVFDVIPEADFASDVLVDEVIYVAADNFLITYDKHTLTRLEMISVPGIRSLAIWEDQLLISRGDYQVFFDSYFQVYDKNTLELLYALETNAGPQYASEGIVVRNDTAYLAINNGFVFGEEVGAVGIIDLKNRSYAGEIDLGHEGRNPDNIMLGENNIYTLNNKDFSGSSISTIDPDTRETSLYDNIAVNSGCGTSALAGGHIYYMEYGVDKLARFDVKSTQIIDTLPGTAAYYGLIDDKINEQLIATWTDFFSAGIAYILDYDGNVLHSFDVGISPGSIALDVRTATGIDDPASADSSVRLFPNPVSNHLTISAEDVISELQVINALGSVIQQLHPTSASTTLAMDGYQSGVYFVQVSLEQGGQRAYRVVKD